MYSNGNSLCLKGVYKIAACKDQSCKKSGLDVQHAYFQHHCCRWGGYLIDACGVTVPPCLVACPDERLRQSGYRYMDKQN